MWETYVCFPQCWHSILLVSISNPFWWSFSLPSLLSSAATSILFPSLFTSRFFAANRKSFILPLWKVVFPWYINCIIDSISECCIPVRFITGYLLSSKCIFKLIDSKSISCFRRKILLNTGLQALRMNLCALISFLSSVIKVTSEKSVVVSKSLIVTFRWSE